MAYVLVKECSTNRVLQSIFRDRIARKVCSGAVHIPVQLIIIQRAVDLGDKGSRINTKDPGKAKHHCRWQKPGNE